MRSRLRARHRLRAPERPVDRASDEEIVALVRACGSARDRLIVLLMARAGLGRGELAGLRCEDVHFLADSSPLGCLLPGRIFTSCVVRTSTGRESVHGKAVPVDAVVVRACDIRLRARSWRGCCRERLRLREPAAGAGRGADAARCGQRPVHEARAAGGAGSPGDASHVQARLRQRRIDAGASLEEAQELLRHALPSSTSVYLHPSQQRRLAAVGRALASRVQRVPPVASCRPRHPARARRATRGHPRLLDGAFLDDPAWTPVAGVLPALDHLLLGRARCSSNAPGPSTRAGGLCEPCYRRHLPSGIHWRRSRPSPTSTAAAASGGARWGAARGRGRARESSYAPPTAASASTVSGCRLTSSWSTLRWGRSGLGPCQVVGRLRPAMGSSGFCHTHAARFRAPADAGSTSSAAADRVLVTELDDVSFRGLPPP